MTTDDRAALAAPTFAERALIDDVERWARGLNETQRDLLAKSIAAIRAEARASLLRRARDDLSIVIDSTDTPEAIEQKMAAVGALVSQTRLAWQRSGWAKHVGRHRFRLLINQPHPETGEPTYIGCEKCGKPQ